MVWLLWLLYFIRFVLSVTLVKVGILVHWAVLKVTCQILEQKLSFHYSAFQM